MSRWWCPRMVRCLVRCRRPAGGGGARAARGAGPPPVRRADARDSRSGEHPRRAPHPGRLMPFTDLRGWITRLEKEGELRRITAQVDWDRELGAITRRVLEKKGPALLFENIKGYTTGRCTRLFTSRP